VKDNVTEFPANPKGRGPQDYEKVATAWDAFNAFLQNYVDLRVFLEGLTRLELLEFRQACSGGAGTDFGIVNIDRLRAFQAMTEVTAGVMATRPDFNQPAPSPSPTTAA
jgi:hypothetical protein